MNPYGLRRETLMLIDRNAYGFDWMPHLNRKDIEFMNRIKILEMPESDTSKRKEKRKNLEYKILLSNKQKIIDVVILDEKV